MDKSSIRRGEHVLRADANLFTIKQRKSIFGRDLREMDSKYGERFWKGIKAAAEGCVTKHIFRPSCRVLWTVKGKKMDYLILDDFYCSCDDFYLNVIIRRKSASCYHLLAKVLADALEIHESVELNDEAYLPLMRKLRGVPKEKPEA
jgi:predicted nucleic acid-binding Zn finger protein